MPDQISECIHRLRYGDTPEAQAWGFAQLSVFQGGPGFEAGACPARPGLQLGGLPRLRGPWKSSLAFRGERESTV